MIKMAWCCLLAIHIAMTLNFMQKGQMCLPKHNNVTNVGEHSEDILGIKQYHYSHII